MSNYVMREGRRIEVETLNSGISATKKSKRAGWIKLPLPWAVKAAKASNTTRALVWIRLLQANWEAGSDTFPLPNGQLKRDGVTRQIKSRVLRELEAAGLITVQRRGRNAPLVTIVRADTP
jgi:hypothetical protein